MLRFFSDYTGNLRDSRVSINIKQKIRKIHRFKTICKYCSSQNFGEGTVHLGNIFGMAAMPFLCRGVWFSPKLSYHRIVSLALYLPIFNFSFYQKTNFHLYKGARLTLLLFTISVDYIVVLLLFHTMLSLLVFSTEKRFLLANRGSKKLSQILFGTIQELHHICF